MPEACLNACGMPPDLLNQPPPCDTPDILNAYFVENPDLLQILDCKYNTRMVRGCLEFNHPASQHVLVPSVILPTLPPDREQPLAAASVAHMAVRAGTWMRTSRMATLDSSTWHVQPLTSCGGSMLTSWPGHAALSCCHWEAQISRR